MNTTYPRVGLGHDTHRLIPGDGFWLGGVRVPHDKSLLGHSDADVLLHAIIDALLGAAALGDIGDMFPDTEPANRGRSSAEMLQLAYERVRDTGWVLRNLDCVVFAQRPKLGRLKHEIAQSIARILEVPHAMVNVKAKTGEGVGPVGEELVMEAQCVALLVSKNAPMAGTMTMVASRPMAASAQAPSLVGSTRAVKGGYMELERDLEPVATHDSQKVDSFIQKEVRK